MVFRKIILPSYDIICVLCISLLLSIDFENNKIINKRKENIIINLKNFSWPIKIAYTIQCFFEKTKTETIKLD